MKATRKLVLAIAALVTVLGLSACGGGGDGNGGFFPIATTPTTTAPPPTTNPPAASDPFDVFVAYVKDLVNTLLDTSEPADIARFDPAPTSETKEPIALQ